LANHTCYRIQPSLFYPLDYLETTLSTIADSPVFNFLYHNSFTGNIENEDGADCILQVTRNKTAVSLLTSGIPKLESAAGAIMSNVFSQKIYTDSRLYVSLGTLSFSSNLLLTKRSMILVLPVLLSPNRMTLKVRFPIVEDVTDIRI
jgi:hypothetical protein